ncbi:hypothetical protein [Pseudomonas sp. Ost2]|uniref:hypothetical protein n=1 Tax=Pseudomonas sp. Ost2 TaxID=2678260 RepID=UPI001BB3F6E2|nr:hypothetical protein [Pseudomonas sp. Ost2]
MSYENFESEIEKTGFVLEHLASTVFRKNGWTIISNKYYIDDHQDVVREIDLVAYKTKNVGDFVVYTALIISCKKDESNVWALLSRELDLRDPNRNFEPLHVWSNNKALRYQTQDAGFSKSYYESSRGLKIKALESPGVDIFAFQEMNKISGTPKNDKNIFASITSLMKAQSYELDSLPSRKKLPCVYHFSLLSIVDSEIIKILFDENTKTASSINSETYIATYIIKRTAQSSRIRFIRFNYLEDVMAEYSELHDFNCGYFSRANEEFYKDAVRNRKKQDILLKDFSEEVSRHLKWRIHRLFRQLINFGDLSLYWNKASERLEIGLPNLKQEEIDKLNSDQESIDIVSKSLLVIYRYKGAWIFEVDIPF